SMAKQFYTTVLKIRNRHLFVLDFVILSLTPVLSLYLRNESFPYIAGLALPLVMVTLVLLLIKIGTFHLFHFYNRFWRYASVDEIGTLAQATSTTSILGVIAFFAVLKPLGLIPSSFPNSIPFIDGILTMLFIGGLRFAVRLVYVYNERGMSDGKIQNVLIAGAGVAGSMIVKELRANPQLAMVPVGFVDDDPRKQHMYLHGVEVLGTIRELGAIVKAKKVTEVVIAMPSVPGKIIREVMNACKEIGVQSKTIPGVFEILSGSAVAQLRDVSIEDLLRRDIVTIDEANVEHLIQGARVMVTGAGGSIGSELCRQIVRFRPKELIMLGHGENSIFAISKELQTKHGVVAAQSVTFTTVIADIRDRERMEHVMYETRPQIIFHAAAHKHVGLMEVNAPDAVTNNVLGTQNLVELAAKINVQKLVMISSDKAVNPMCVMGVTKRVAELVVRDAALRHKKPFVVVRFGNVLGSRGSVVPIFKKQIAAGGPVTITHPEVTRFFMTIPEAVRLVLQAGALGSCAETFVLDMGEPVKIVDLARDLIRLSGLREGEDIDIKYTGLIEGEKMYEELFYEHEHADRSTHRKIFVCRNAPAQDLSGVLGDASADLEKFGEELHRARLAEKEREAFKFSIEHLLIAAHEGDAEYTNELLKKIVPQYSNPVLDRIFRTHNDRTEAENKAFIAANPAATLIGADKILLKFPKGHADDAGIEAPAPQAEPALIPDEPVENVAVGRPLP
ncbi:MAG: polysaccharide biosynthesis protein, partial [Acidobacteriota bacterium]